MIVELPRLGVARIVDEDRRTGFPIGQYRPLAAAPAGLPVSDGAEDGVVFVLAKHARAVVIMYLWSALIAGGAVTVAFAHSRLLLVLASFLGAAAVLLVASNVPRLRHAPHA